MHMQSKYKEKCRNISTYFKVNSQTKSLNAAMDSWHELN